LCYHATFTNPSVVFFHYNDAHIPWRCKFGYHASTILNLAIHAPNTIIPTHHITNTRKNPCELIGQNKNLFQVLIGIGGLNWSNMLNTFISTRSVGKWTF
jgi:hypothetical protein